MNKHRQYGEGMGGMIMLLAIVGVVAWFGMKAIPLYMENGKVATIMDNIKEDAGTKVPSPTQLKSSFLQKLQFEDIYVIKSTNYKEYVTLERTSTGYNMIVQYDNTVPLFGDFHLVAKFDKTIVMP